jgi:hypothetical protein
MDIPPIFWLDAVERGDLARAVHAAKDFSDLSPGYQRLVLEAEAERERLIAELRGARSA